MEKTFGGGAGFVSKKTYVLEFFCFGKHIPSGAVKEHGTHESTSLTILFFKFSFSVVLIFLVRMCDSGMGFRPCKQIPLCFKFERAIVFMCSRKARGLYVL